MKPEFRVLYVNEEETEVAATFNNLKEACRFCDDLERRGGDVLSTNFEREEGSQ